MYVCSVTVVRGNVNYFGCSTCLFNLITLMATMKIGHQPSIMEIVRKVIHRKVVHAQGANRNKIMWARHGRIQEGCGSENLGVRSPTPNPLLGSFVKRGTCACKYVASETVPEHLFLFEILDPSLKLFF